MTEKISLLAVPLLNAIAFLLVLAPVVAFWVEEELDIFKKHKNNRHKRKQKTKRSE